MEITELKAELEKLHQASFGWALNCCRHNGVEAEEVLQTVYLKVLQGNSAFGEVLRLTTTVGAALRGPPFGVVAPSGAIAVRRSRGRRL